MLKTPSELCEESKKSIPEISAADVKRDLDGGKLPYLLLDVREPQEHAAGMIPQALALPRGLIEIQIGKVLQDENAPIVCYCGGGTRSLFAGEQLKRVGFKNVKSMAGGFKAWIGGGGAVQKPGA